MLTLSSPPTAIHFKGSCCAKKIPQPKTDPLPSPNGSHQGAEPRTEPAKADPPSGIMASLKQQVQQWVQEFWRILTTDFWALFRGNEPPEKKPTSQ
ncbi:hypothetical protein [Vampirovibrio chlorellavorus]|uniref:hypothetical protein n=1 Tax=Vampirovibrio chlorellavorus TaxID=758823 RepID=UPI0026EDC381|nr:hypothetical protein [Vampirovibrio chlorellavorus]